MERKCSAAEQRVSAQWPLSLRIICSQPPIHFSEDGLHKFPDEQMPALRVLPGKFCFKLAVSLLAARNISLSPRPSWAGKTLGTRSVSPLPSTFSRGRTEVLPESPMRVHDLRRYGPPGASKTKAAVNMAQPASRIERLHSPGPPQSIVSSARRSSSGSSARGPRFRQRHP